MTLSSSVIVNQIVLKARKLKATNNYKTIFVNRDLSHEERTKQRELVLELKKRAEETPGMRHFIRGGKVQSVEKT